MYSKLASALGCALMALSVLAPLASAHNNGGYTAAADTAIANGGGLPTPAVGYLNGDSSGNIRLGTSNGYVSGRYVSSHEGGPALQADGSAFNIPVDGSDVNLLPAGIFLPAGGALCDMEVQVDSNTSPLGLANENKVDGTGTIGMAANGLWDDGGLDGACHVTTYGTGAFNTAGCPDASNTAGVKAYAEDAVSGSTIETAAGCDLYTVETPSGSSTGLVALAACGLNEVILQTDANAASACLETYFGCASGDFGTATCNDQIVNDETGCAGVNTLVACLTGGAFITCVEGNLGLGAVSCLPPLGGDVIGINHCDYPSSLSSNAETCAIHTLNCELNPGAGDSFPSGCFYPPTMTCGSDSLTDSINYGEGSLTAPSSTDPANLAVISGAGAAWPTDCAASNNGAAQQYVMDGVHVTYNGGTDLTVHVSIATTGFVDSA